MKTAEEMKKQISLFVEYKDHDRVILSNANGDAFSSKSEDLIDFLHGIKDSQSELPSDGITKFTEKEIDAAKSVRDSFLNQAGVERYKQVYMAGEIVMSDQLQPLLAYHVARIKELEEKLSKADVTGMYDVECICSVFGEFKHCKSCYPITNK